MTSQVFLYRMVTAKHICPFSLKSKDLLQRRGYAVDDRMPISSEQTERLKREMNGDTTPQASIDSQRIGGYDELREFFNLKPENTDRTSYSPMICSQ